MPVQRDSNPKEKEEKESRSEEDEEPEQQDQEQTPWSGRDWSFEIDGDKVVKLPAEVGDYLFCTLRVLSNPYHV